MLLKQDYILCIQVKKMNEESLSDLEFNKNVCILNLG